MEDADLSFASLLLALRHSTDELDRPNLMPVVKTPMNFHKDFYRNSSYDNECSNAAESLTTLSSCSTDIDSPIGGVVVNRNPPLSSIGWKRRSDPCINTAGLLVENQKEFPASTKSSISGTRSFDYGPGTNAAVVQNTHSNGFQPYVFAENVPRKSQPNNPEVKKLCRPSSASRSESQSGRASTKSKASSSASQEPSYKDGHNEKLEMQKEILNNRKMNRELKNQKKELKEMNREVIVSGERSLSDNKSCFETFIGICQSAEDRKDLEAAAKNEARLLKIARGRYKCSRCGALKTNHDCPIIEEYAGSVATQVERITLKSEEFLSGGIAGFSVALRTCNLLAVRANYCPTAAHTSGLGQAKNNNHSKNNNSNKNNNNNSSSSSSSSSVGFKSDAMLNGPPLLDFARSPAFNSTMQRSMSYSAVGELCGNDTDHNTTNSNSDNDSDSKSFSRGKNFQHNHSTDSEASATPSLLISASALSRSPLPANRLTTLTVPGLNGLENKIGGLGVFSVGKEGNNVNTFASLNRSDKGSVGVEQIVLKREISDPKCSPGSYHLTYQTISTFGSNSGNGSALPSPRDQDLPLPL